MYYISTYTVRSDSFITWKMSADIIALTLIDIVISQIAADDSELHLIGLMVFRP